MGRGIETPEYAKFVRRILRGYARRVAVADEVDLAEMDKIGRDFDEIMVTAIAGQLARGRSWTYVAAGLGVSRQAARQRWSDRVKAITE